MEDSGKSGWRVDPNPPKPGPAIPLIRLKQDQEVSAVVLSPAIWGVWTHWNGRTSEPCYTHKDDCPGCKRGYPRRWKGYIHAILTDTRREAFLEMTPTSAQALMQQLESKEELRGSHVTMKRGSKAANSHISILTWKAKTPNEALPLAKDPSSILEKLWGLSDRSCPTAA